MVYLLLLVIRDLLVPTAQLILLLLQQVNEQFVKEYGLTEVCLLDEYLDQLLIDYLQPPLVLDIHQYLQHLLDGLQVQLVAKSLLLELDQGLEVIDTLHQLVGLLEEARVDQLVLPVEASESIHEAVDVIEFLEYLGEEGEVDQVVEEVDQNVEQYLLQVGGQDALVETVSQGVYVRDLHVFEQDEEVFLSVQLFILFVEGIEGGNVAALFPDHVQQIVIQTAIGHELELLQCVRYT